MLKLGPIQVENSLLDAIRDDRLVIFAGAGVSVGPPANLPDFGNLATDIAAATGFERTDQEPIDHFLGRLQHNGVNVHSEVAKRLCDPGSAPTALHLDLMRMFRSPESLRLVTTNFDLHFETAAQTVFGRCPDIYRAPALPLGRDFTGLVHVHGALTRSREMVLTDADFGRGYLTEGWARRFLLDVFRTYTVLFVGYSHNDVVMKYLARALPIDGLADRYALTEEDGSWKLFGITPILYRKSNEENVFQELYDGIQYLAEHTTRGVLDWQSKLAEIGSQAPPEDGGTITEIEQALREVHTTRFLTNVARRPAWPRWLQARNQLNALFDHAPLSERDKLLMSWLATNYVIEHGDEVIRLIVTHNLRLNPDFWWAIGRELALNDEKQIDSGALSRWISILLACAPVHADPHVLEWLAMRCGKQGCIKLVTEVFLFMGSSRLTIKPHLGDEGDPSHFEVSTPLLGEHYGLNRVWENHLKLNLAVIAQPLLYGVAQKLEEMHQIRSAWNTAGHDWGDPTWGRSAIEPHEQDKYPESIDALINGARDTIEWLALNQPISFDNWMERLVVSDVPLLRRLSIHALTLHPHKSPDESLSWLLRVGLHTRSERHEVYRAAALAYPKASHPLRQLIIEAVLKYQVSDTDGVPIVEQAAREHFNWLDWLQQSDPACSLLHTALAPIKTAYPQWISRDYPDLSHWVRSGSRAMESPWTVEQVLAKPPADQLDDLLNFKGSYFDGPNREGLRSVVQEACKQQPLWAFQLDISLSGRAEWHSDLWSSVFGGIREAKLNFDEWNVALKSVSRDELQSRYSREIADLLYTLVRDNDTSGKHLLHEEAHIIAGKLWRMLSSGDEEGSETDWLMKAINHPAGIVVEFWIKALSYTLHSKSQDDRWLPDNYRELFTLVVQNETAVGGMGRCVLASQVAFLFSLHESWTREYIIPLFTSTDSRKFRQAWDGFLTWGKLYNTLADVLKPAFISALPLINTGNIKPRRRFIELFTTLVVFHVTDPTLDLLPALLRHGSVEDRNSFAYRLGTFLGNMSPSMRQNLWDRWVCRYWENRITSASLPLAKTEMRAMLNWLPHLGELFPAGVSLAVSATPTLLEHCDLIHEMRECDLVIRFPADTAKLFIYLCPLLPEYHQADVVEVVNRLPALGAHLQKQLDEAMAHAGFS